MVKSQFSGEKLLNWTFGFASSEIVAFFIATSATPNLWDKRAVSDASSEYSSGEKL